MGRKQKYFTEEEIKKANRIKAKRYYWVNKEKVDEKAKEKYRQKNKVFKPG